MWCNDPFQDQLRRRGYCIVSLPRASITPLMLLGRMGSRYEPIGQLSDILVAEEGVVVPTLELDSAVAGFSSLRTGTLRTGVGLNILAGVVEALGGEPTTLKSAYANSRTLTLELNDIHEDRVPITEVEKHLAASDLNPLSKHTARLLHIGSIYLITSTLKTSQLEVEAESKRSGEVAVSAAAVSAAGIQGQVTVDAAQGTKSRVHYSGSGALVFAFKAIQLSYRDGQFVRYIPADPKNTKLSGDAGGGGFAQSDSEYLQPDVPMLDLEMPS